VTATDPVTDPAPSLAAIVVSHHTGPVLWDALDALLREPALAELIVVDNDNPPEIVARLQALAEGSDGRARLLSGHGNVGFARGCNLGATVARADALVFVNPDCIVDPGALASLARALAQAPGGLVGGFVRNPDGTEQRGCRRGELTLWSATIAFLGLGRPGAEAGLLRDFNRTREPLPDVLAPIPTVSGAFMAMATRDFRALGGFDEGFFLHLEDVDLCRRTRDAGGAVLFAPDSTAVHVGGTSRTPAWRVEAAKAAGFLRYFWKNARTPLSKVGVLLWWPMIALALAIRAGLLAMRVKTGG
jgi:GT2 family glycosyltransferase